MQDAQNGRTILTREGKQDETESALPIPPRHDALRSVRFVQILPYIG